MSIEIIIVLAILVVIFLGQGVIIEAIAALCLVVLFLLIKYSEWSGSAGTTDFTDGVQSEAPIIIPIRFPSWYGKDYEFEIDSTVSVPTELEVSTEYATAVKYRFPISYRIPKLDICYQIFVNGLIGISARPMQGLLPLYRSIDNESREAWFIFCLRDRKLNRYRVAEFTGLPRHVFLTH